MVPRKHTCLLESADGSRRGALNVDLAAAARVRLSRMARAPEVPPGFETGYRVEWLYREPPSLDPTAIQKALSDTLPESLVEELEPGHLSVAHTGSTVEFADGAGKAMTAVFMAKNRPVSQQEFEVAIQQTWTWPRDDAKARIKRSKARVLVMDFMSLGQPYQTRLRLVYEVARAVARTTQPEVGFWLPAGQMVAPEMLTDDPLDAALNVRLFRVENHPGDQVMDTLGLAALGAPDVQCHFHGIEPGAIAGVLRRVGAYVFEKGDVIADGETVQGLEKTDKWACRHEMALLPPQRVVVDINPGPTYSTRPTK